MVNVTLRDGVRSEPVDRLKLMSAVLLEGVPRFSLFPFEPSANSLNALHFFFDETALSLSNSVCKKRLVDFLTRACLSGLQKPAQ